MQDFRHLPFSDIAAIYPSSAAIRPTVYGLMGLRVDILTRKKVELIQNKNHNVLIKTSETKWPRTEHNKNFDQWHSLPQNERKKMN